MGGASSRDVNKWTRRSPSFHGRNYLSELNCDDRMHGMHSKYSRIGDNYGNLKEVTEALQRAGLESSNLIVGIDFTKSNKWTGKYSFNGCCLHGPCATLNPYEQAISIIGETLSPFDEDNLIPCFGFGDASTHDQDVFSFYPDGRPCNGFREALSRYQQIVPHLQFSGPTSFAPVIEMAMTIVEERGGLYHILLIIADGQVAESKNYGSDQLSYQEQKTIETIVKASEFPLSIIVVGVGDGPWDMMKKFDDSIPERSFDNFQFVHLTEIMSKNMPQSRKESEFALAALMEIPSQYTAILSLGLLGDRAAISPKRIPLPPPYRSYATAFSGSNGFRSTSFQQSILLHSGYNSIPAPIPPAASAAFYSQICSVCMMNPKDMAFDCGHQTCNGCGLSLQPCPICYCRITKRIKLL